MKHNKVKHVFRCVGNFFKTLYITIRFPFMTMYDYNGKRVWEASFYDCLPEGWQKAFGFDLMKDLKKAAKKDKLKLVIYDVKEKWGFLNIYTNAEFDSATNDVIAKYEELSKKVCINCGKPSKYRTTGWIAYYCEDCAKDINPKLRVEVNKDE